MRYTTGVTGTTGTTTTCTTSATGKKDTADTTGSTGQTGTTGTTGTERMCGAEGGKEEEEERWAEEGVRASWLNVNNYLCSGVFVRC